MDRRVPSRSMLFAIGGALVLCACLCIGVAGVLLVANPFSSGGKTAGVSLPFVSGPAPTPTESGPTPVPLNKSAKNASGLRLTVTAYQRPLPAQDVEIPEGQELVLVTVKLENTRATGGPIKYSPDDFKLLSPEGDSFAADTQGLTTGSVLKKGEIETGKSVKGDLIFYVYSDVADLMLSWTSPDGAEILFKLTRK